MEFRLQATQRTVSRLSVGGAEGAARGRVHRGRQQIVVFPRLGCFFFFVAVTWLFVIDGLIVGVLLGASAKWAERQDDEEADDHDQGQKGKDQQACSRINA